MPALKRRAKKNKNAVPRRRNVPRWVKPTLRIGIAATVTLGVVGGGLVAWKSGAIASSVETVRARTIAASAALGFTVQDVLVQGRNETSREAILAALALARGTPMLTVDPEAAKARIEALPWVKTAAVERRFPGTIFVRLVERTPMALWQKDEKLALVDDEGHVLTRENLRRFHELPIVIGDGAPEAAPAILKVLAAEPELYKRIEALTYVGARRWDVRFAGGVEIKLPEADPGRAWAQLADADRREQLLARDISVVDMRLPDRLVVRLAHPPEAKPKPKTKGKSA